MSMRGPAIALLLVLVAALVLLFQRPDTRAQIESANQATDSLGPQNIELLARVELLESKLASQSQDRMLRDLQQRISVLEQKVNRLGSTGRGSTSGQLDASRSRRDFGDIQRQVSSVESKLTSVQRDLSPLKQEISSLKQKVRELDTTVARIDYRR